MPPSERDQANVNNRNSQQRQPQNIDSRANEEIRSQKWAVIVASVAKQSYDSQVQQYKEWRSTLSHFEANLAEFP